MKNDRILIALAITVAYSIAAAGLPAPNRGKQLFLLIEDHSGRGPIVATDEPSRWIIQEWNRYNPTYDFISASVARSDAGCQVTCTRCVMKEDYISRVEHATLAFPYTEQPRYQFFDYGHITGFYRNSVHDIDAREFLPRQSPNQSIQPTAGRRTIKISMTRTSHPAATRALISSHCSLPLRASVYVMPWQRIPFARGGSSCSR